MARGCVVYGDTNTSTNIVLAATAGQSVSSISSIDPTSSTIPATQALPVAYDEPPPLDLYAASTVCCIKSARSDSTNRTLCGVMHRPLSFLERNRLSTFAATPPPHFPICTTEKGSALWCKSVSIASELPYLLFTDTCLASTSSFPLASSSSRETF